MAAFEDTFGVVLKDVIPEIREEKNALDGSANRPKDVQRFTVVEQLFAAHLTACPLCGVHGCGAHGDYESSDDEEPVINKKYCDLNMPFDSMLQRHNEKLARNKVRTTGGYFKDCEACSVHCFLRNGDDAEYYDEWTPEDLTYLECLTSGMENERRTSCVLAPLVGRSCYAVFYRMRLNSTAAENLPKESSERPFLPGKLDWYDNKTRTIRTDQNWREKTKTHVHEKRRQPFGCNHKGLSCHKAGDQCHCFHENTLCDKFCSCSDACKFLSSLKQPYLS